MNTPLIDNTAILVLGGDVERELYALTLLDTLAYRSARLYISSGDLHEHNPFIEKLGTRCTIDRTAVDTLTNFTTLAPSFQASGIQFVLVVTSPSHARRAQSVAGIVLGHYRLPFELNTVPWETTARSESWLRIVRDIIRTYVWLLTGWTGERVTTWFHPTRRPK